VKHSATLPQPILDCGAFPPLLFFVFDAMAKRGEDDQTETKAAEKRRSPRGLPNLNSGALYSPRPLRLSCSACKKRLMSSADFADDRRFESDALRASNSRPRSDPIHTRECNRSARMKKFLWLARLRGPKLSRNAVRRCRPSVQALEDRTVPSTFFVSNRNDDGLGSLRQAVLDANANPGADTIKFKHSAEGTITLASQLTVTGDTAITGPGANDLTVSGGGVVTRIFEIAAGATVGMEKLTIANAAGTPFGNEAILNSGTLTLERSVIASNAGSGVGTVSDGTLTVKSSLITQNGGMGIRTFGGTTNINHSDISHNHAGGVFASGSGPATTIQFTNVTDNNGGAGAGITIYGSGNPMTAVLDHVFVSRNSGGITGGVELNASGPADELIITNSIISGNSADLTPGSYPSVGGIHTYLGRLILRDSVVSGNTGLIVGGVDADSGYGLEVTRSTISNNQASIDNSYPTIGGLSIVYQNAPVLIQDTTISGNVGNVAGGAFCFEDREISIVRSTISGNTAIAHSVSYFGSVGGLNAFFAFFQYTTIDNATISGNTVVADELTSNFAAGGLVLVGSIDHSTIAFNSVVNAPESASVAGGLISYGSTVRNTIVAGNSANNGGPDVFGTLASGGHNLIGILTADATGFVASDLSGTAATPLDPGLRPLGKYGGPTKTHALRHSSLAINAGDNTDAPPTDQRGRTRIVGGTIDIGAYESSFKNGQDDDHDAPMRRRSRPAGVDTLLTQLAADTTHKVANVAASTAIAKHRSIPAAAQVEQFGKAAIHHVGGPLGLSLIPIAEPPGLELTL
jgi:hypothetical protein